eukprot:3393149-Pyramimonas_sp.AAC.1
MDTPTHPQRTHPHTCEGQTRTPAKDKPAHPRRAHPHTREGHTRTPALRPELDGGVYTCACDGHDNVLRWSGSVPLDPLTVRANPLTVHTNPLTVRPH